MGMNKCCTCCGVGRKGGCPECKMYPLEGTKVVDEVKYKFVTNADLGSKTQEGYKALQESKKARVLFENATDRYNNPMPKCVEIWLAIEDREIAENAGLWVFGTGKL